MSGRVILDLATHATSCPTCWRVDCPSGLSRFVPSQRTSFAMIRLAGQEVSRTADGHAWRTSTVPDGLSATRTRHRRQHLRRYDTDPALSPGSCRCGQPVRRAGWLCHQLVTVTPLARSAATWSAGSSSSGSICTVRRLRSASMPSSDRMLNSSDSPS